MTKTRGWKRGGKKSVGKKSVGANYQYSSDTFYNEQTLFPIVNTR
jgi:hypothetical protein